MISPSPTFPMTFNLYPLRFLGVRELEPPVHGDEFAKTVERRNSGRMSPESERVPQQTPLGHAQGMPGVRTDRPSPQEGQVAGMRQGGTPEHGAFARNGDVEEELGDDDADGDSSGGKSTLFESFLSVSRHDHSTTSILIISMLIARGLIRHLLAVRCMT